MIKRANIAGLSEQEDFPDLWTNPDREQNVELIAHEEIENNEDSLLMKRIIETISNLSALVRDGGGYFTEHTFMTSESRFTTVVIENSTGHVIFPAKQKNSKSCDIVEGPHPSDCKRRRIMLLSKAEIPSNFGPGELPPECVLREVESFTDLISSRIGTYITPVGFYLTFHTHPGLFVMMHQHFLPTPIVLHNFFYRRRIMVQFIWLVTPLRHHIKFNGLLTINLLLCRNV
jgi:hypothetical protein